MRQYIKEIGAHGIIYTISNVLNKTIGLILIPIYARFLTVSDYGILAIITPFIATILVLYSFGLRSSYTRFYFDQTDSKYQRQLLGNTLFTSFIIGTAFFAVLILFGQSFLEGLFPGIPYVPFFRYALLIAYFSIYYEILLNVYRTKRKSVSYGILSVIRFTLVIVLTIILVVRYKQGALGKVLAEFYVTLGFFLICMILLLREARFNLDFSLIKSMLAYALPIVPHMLSTIIIRIAAQQIINKSEGLDATGVYNMGFLIGSIISLVAISINQSWGPLFMKMATKDESKARLIFSQLTTYYTLLVLVFSFFLIVFNENIVLLLASEKYMGSIAVVPVIIVSFGLNAIYFVLANSIMINKKQVRLLPLLTISAAGINIVANIILIRIYGIIGAAYAHLITNLFMVVLGFFIAQKAFHMKYEYRRIALLFVAVGLSYLCFLLLESFSIQRMYLEMALKLVLTLLPLGLLFLFRFFRKSELLNLLDIYKKIRIQYLGR
jgi:O-antigen/teichoic acid export membrane protein